MTEYEKYQLEWMAEHGISLKRLIEQLALFEREGADNATEAMDMVESNGIGGELWACEEEWNECDRPLAEEE